MNKRSDDMNWKSYGKTKSEQYAVSTLLSALSLALALTGCLSAHEDDQPVVNKADPDLEALMADGVLPSEMMPDPNMPAPPPRFCGGGGGGFAGGIPFPPFDQDAGVSLPDAGGMNQAGSPSTKPIIIASSGSAGGFASPPIAAGAAAPVGVAGSVGPGGAAGSVGSDGAAGTSASEPDPACAALPIGFWTFDDCNNTRTDLSDSSFQGHNAFRNVDMACTNGQVGLAADFVHASDLVYAPDQPDFGLDAGVTVAAWVKPTNVHTLQTLFRKRDDKNSAFALLINDRKFQFRGAAGIGSFGGRVCSGNCRSVDARRGDLRPQLLAHLH